MGEFFKGIGFNNVHLINTVVVIFLVCIIIKFKDVRKSIKNVAKNHWKFLIIISLIYGGIIGVGVILDILKENMISDIVLGFIIYWGLVLKTNLGMDRKINGELKSAFNVIDVLTFLIMIINQSIFLLVLLNIIALFRFVLRRDVKLYKSRGGIRLEKALKILTVYCIVDMYCNTILKLITNSNSVNIKDIFIAFTFPLIVTMIMKVVGNILSMIDFYGWTGRWLEFTENSKYKCLANFKIKMLFKYIKSNRKKEFRQMITRNIYKARDGQEALKMYEMLLEDLKKEGFK